MKKTKRVSKTRLMNLSTKVKQTIKTVKEESQRCINIEAPLQILPCEEEMMKATTVVSKAF
jgi:hypothetical protein